MPQVETSTCKHETSWTKAVRRTTPVSARMQQRNWGNPASEVTDWWASVGAAAPPDWICPTGASQARGRPRIMAASLSIAGAANTYAEYQRAHDKHLLHFPGLNTAVRSEARLRRNFCLSVARTSATPSILIDFCAQIPSLHTCLHHHHSSSQQPARVASPSRARDQATLLPHIYLPPHLFHAHLSHTRHSEPYAPRRKTSPTRLSFPTLLPHPRWQTRLPPPRL